MLQVNRNNNLKIPKQIEIDLNDTNTISDTIETKKAILKADNQKINTEKIKKEVQEDDEALKTISKIPFNANDLIVITIVKKLTAYVITVTEKSPKKFRNVFVVRMQNYCLDTLELLVNANYIRMDSHENKKTRENYQKEAIIKLKLLGYMAMVAENSGCILKKQYKQISIQLAESINLISAWKKSDDERFKKR